ncbi:MAG: hypothetical protein ACXVBJ_08575 [Flavisolibacter sp.]
MEKTDEEGLILYEEVQQFTGVSIRNFSKGLLGIVFLALIVSLIIQKGRFTDYNKLLIVLLPILLVVNIILGSKLILQIRTDGIYVRFPPWQPKFTTLSWTDIEEIDVREYRPMREFMGWGIRYAPRRMGYIVAGNNCIEVVLKNGYTVIITTQRKEEVNEVLKRIEV